MKLVSRLLALIIAWRAARRALTDGPAPVA
ncbi:MAG: hypothetical protein JWO02_2294, partial [Solirubrobacterales bacterium]|nr:hypothetical protein [Solirubrobacterales bacterium]